MAKEWLLDIVSYKSKLWYKRPTLSACEFSAISTFDLALKLNNRLSILYMLWQGQPKSLTSIFDSFGAISYCFCPW